MAYSKAHMKATNKWLKNNYDNICLTLKKGRKDIWKQAADQENLSLNEFIRSCVEEKISNLNL